MDEDFDSLREKSTRTSSVYDDIEAGEPEEEERSGVLRGLTAQQRLILALLLFIDLVALACAVLIWTGQIL
jgi:hypothetical protein